MYNKRGQFYLVAAIIIVAVLISFVTIRNIAITRNSAESIKLYEISKELQLEGESVINHGIFQATNLDVLLGKFATDYGEYISDKENDIFFIHGDTKEVTIIGYVNVQTGSVGLTIGGSPRIDILMTGIDTPTNKIVGNYLTDPNVLVDIGGTKYPFVIKKGQNFFFIVRQPAGGNTQIGVSNS